MSIVLKQLERFCKLEFSKEVSFELVMKLPIEKQHLLFAYWADQDARLAVEYVALRMMLQKTLLTLKGSQDEATKAKSVAKAQALLKELFEFACLLDYYYSSYVNSPANLSHRDLNRHEEQYCSRLSQDNQRTKPTDVKADVSPLEVVNEATDRLNPYRLFGLRDWRFHRLLIPIVNNAQYTHCILECNLAVSGVLSYLGIIYFVPRLMSDLFRFSVHVFGLPGRQMSAGERSLGWQRRLSIQWARLWPSIMNDVAWISNGVLLFFLFTGSLLPMAIFLAVSVQFYDLFFGSLQAYVGITQLNALEDEYKKTLSAMSDDDPDKALMEEYLVSLQQRITLQRYQLYRLPLNFAALFLGMCLALPFFVACSPWLPAMGAALAVVITVLNFGSLSYIRGLMMKETSEINSLLPLLPPPKKLNVENKGAQAPLTRPKSSPDFFGKKTSFLDQVVLLRTSSSCDKLTRSSPDGVNNTWSTDSLANLCAHATLTI
jgi:hypothetical protein